MYLKGMDREVCTYKGLTENRVSTQVGQNRVPTRGVRVPRRGGGRTVYLQGVDREPCTYTGWTENRVPTRGGQRTEYLQGVDREPCTYKGWTENRVPTRGRQRTVYLQGVDRVEDPAHHVLEAVLVHLLHGVALDAARRHERPGNDRREQTAQH